DAPTAMPWQFGPGGIDFYREMEAIEDRIIAQALRLSGGNKKEAARLLHVNRTTLLEKLKRKRAQGSPLCVLLGASRDAEPEAPPALDLTIPPPAATPSDPVEFGAPSITDAVPVGVDAESPPAIACAGF